MGSGASRDERDEEYWRRFLENPDTMMSVGRVVLNRLSPGEFRALLDRFYEAASTAVLDNGGIVDKFVGRRPSRGALRPNG